MADQDYSDRERRARSMDNDWWDWDYYYEYRYIPYSPYRNDYNRYYYGRDYDRDTYGTSRPGRYTGVGPRGYQRSDERILEDVNERLTWHGELDATDIVVDVDEGVVTLTGEVNSRREKRIAEDTAESVPGVWDVDNQLKIRNRARAEGRRNHPEVRPGMEVIGKMGTHIGEVTEVRTNDFLVDRSMDRDVYIPFSACQTTDDGRVRLNVRAEDVDEQGWEMPELLETSQRSHKKH